MVTVNTSHNNINILFCIFLIISSCNNISNKTVIEDTKLTSTIINVEPKVNFNSSPVKKVLKNKSILPKNENVIFEFKNERLLQGVDKENLEDNKSNKAITAVYKMFKKNLSTLNKVDDANKKKNSSMYTDYLNNSFNIKNSKFSKNVLVFLPFTGPYSHFGLDIRKAIDLSILKFGTNDIKIIYIDTQSDFVESEIKNLLDTLNPSLIIGPFTRESLLKIKMFVRSKNIPTLTFSNDIAMVERNVWSLGFSPEEQVESVVSCALKHGFNKFGIIVPDNLYGEIISNTSIDLISQNQNNYFQKLLLSNEQLNNKEDLFYLLKQFLNFRGNEIISSKFDAIFLGGSKDFILEISPLLAFYNVDSKQTQILGTENFKIKDIRNEPSLEKSWFPIILDQNNKEFSSIWETAWGNKKNYFSSAAFDTGLIAINYLNQNKSPEEFFSDLKGSVTGFIFNSNGHVKKPIHVMQIENLEKLKIVENCKNLG